MFKLVKWVCEWSAESMASQPSQAVLWRVPLAHSGSVYWAPQQGAHESRVCRYRAGYTVALETPDCGLSDSQSTSVPPSMFTETPPISVSTLRKRFIPC